MSGRGGGEEGEGEGEGGEGEIQRSWELEGDSQRRQQILDRISEE